MTIEQFKEELQKIGINITNKQLEQFEIYYATLVEWNEKMNLTAIIKKEDVYEKHFYDCILASTVYNFSNQKLCDVGAGAGFPSVPLKIIYPDLDITIVDSLAKRITFLNHLSSVLEISNFKAIAARAEEYAIDNRSRYDVVLARAVARLNILGELCLPMVKLGGSFIALKGLQGSEEHVEAKQGIDTLGATLKDLKEYHLISDDSTRTIILYQKYRENAHKYPRAYSQIKKSPL